MISFLQLLENMSQNKDSHHELKAMEAVRVGKNISENFWDDFIMVTNNADSLADLLDVRVDQVTGWAAKIKKILAEIEEKDKNKDSEEDKENSKILPTGMI